MPERSPDDWTIAAGKVGANRTIVRALSHLPPKQDRAERPLLIRVTWTYDATLSGMPDEATQDEIETFEAAIFASLDQKDWATEVAAITGNGAKQWRFYCADGDDFVTHFHEALEGHLEYPLELEGINDADWRGLRDVLPA